MTVDKFGHFLKEIRKQRPYTHHLNFQVDEDQNYNFNFRRIKNINDPILSNDAVNKKYFEQILERKNQNTKTIEKELIKKIEDLEVKLLTIFDTKFAKLLTTIETHAANEFLRHLERSYKPSEP